MKFRRLLQDFLLYCRGLDDDVFVRIVRRDSEGCTTHAATVPVAYSRPNGDIVIEESQIEWKEAR
jgi:hypothetical protein